MEVSSLISLFGQESGIPLSLGESGTIDLVFENDVTVTLEHDDPQDVLHCYIVLGHEPAEPDVRAVIYRNLLAANAFGHDTDGACLGLDELTGEILLTRRLELLDANVSLLRNMVQSMVNTAVVWRENLNSSARDTTPYSGQAPSPSTIPARNMRA